MDHIQRGNPSRQPVSGPLALYAEGWRAELAVRGYSRHTVLAHAQLMAHLSGWMADAGIGALNDPVITGYLEARHAEGYRTRAGSRVLLPLLGYLRDLGAVPPPGGLPGTAAEALLEEFAGYLAAERGPAAGTVQRYVRFGRVLLDGLGIIAAADLPAVTAESVVSFTLGQAVRPPSGRPCAGPGGHAGPGDRGAVAAEVPARHGQDLRAAGRRGADGARAAGRLAPARARPRPGRRAGSPPARPPRCWPPPARPPRCWPPATGTAPPGSATTRSS